MYLIALARMAAALKLAQRRHPTHSFFRAENLRVSQNNKEKEKTKNKKMEEEKKKKKKEKRKEEEGG